MRLLPDGPELGTLLHDLARRRKDLRIRVLAWDVTSVFALERGFLRAFGLGSIAGPRVEFELDSEHPLEGAPHQKIVSIDDTLAFVGGLDLTTRRWDTREHRARDRRRRDPEGLAYAPFHDVQCMVDGPAAAALADLCRRRWLQATDRRVRPALRQRTRESLMRLVGREAPAEPATDPWPDNVAPDLRDVMVGIARTEPTYVGHPEVREVERLHLAAIASARRYVYIENQYFTSATVSQALARRFSEVPELEAVIVQPARCSGWLEESTMGVLRNRALRMVGDAAGGRLRVVHPIVSGDVAVKVHSKLEIVDDTSLRIGSANLSNRSMAVDFECDLIVESDGDAATEGAIRGILHRLLAEHCGTTPEQVAEVLSTGSLVQAVDALGSDQRRLEPLPLAAPGWLSVLEPAIALADPERPHDAFDDLPHDLAVIEAGRWGRSTVARALLMGAFLVGLPLLWSALAVGHGSDARTLAEIVAPWSSDPRGPLVAIAAFVAGGLVVFPVTVLIVATVLAFGPFWGALIALAGASCSAFVTYVIGRGAGRGIMRRLAGRRVNRISRALARHGLLAVAASRVLPLAPFTVVNVVAGASHIRPYDFVVGTILGLVPGVIACAVLTDALAHPGARSAAGLAMFAVFAGVTLLWAAWRSRQRNLEGRGP